MRWQSLVPALFFASNVFAGYGWFLAPDKFGKKVEGHVQQIFQEGYAKELAPEDFDHGHIIIKNGIKESSTIEEIIDQTFIFLYHTDERSDEQKRWLNSSLPPEQRVQRSIIVYNSGEVMPAKDLFSSEQLKLLGNYASRGTIHDFDIKRLFGLSSDYMHRVNIKECDCNVNTQFYIEPAPQGRYSVQDQKFDVYLEKY